MKPTRWTLREEQLLFKYVRSHITGQNQIDWKDVSVLFENRTLAQITSKFNRMKREECNMWSIDDLKTQKTGYKADAKARSEIPLKFEIDENKNYSDVPGSVVKAWYDIL